MGLKRQAPERHPGGMGTIAEALFFDDCRPGVDVRVQPAPQLTSIPPQEVVVEQRLFVNEVFVVNPTKWTCTVNVIAEHPSPALNSGEYTIEPGDTLRIGAYTMGGTFAEPENHVRITVYRDLRKTAYYKLSNFRMNTVQAGPEHRRYFNVMHGWTTTK